MSLRHFGTVLVAGLLVALAAYAVAEIAPLDIGSLAPMLEIEVLQGEPVDMIAGRGEKVYVVEFWATWCGPCRRSIPHLSALYNRYKGKGLEVVGISDEDAKTVEPYVKRMGKQMSYTVAVDQDRSTMKRYMNGFGVSTIPHAFIVDWNGQVIWHGNPLEPIFEDIVEALIEEGPPERDENAVVGPPAPTGK